MFKTIASVVTALLFLAWTSAAQATLIEVVTDGGFEGGSPNAAWAESSTNFGTPLCTEALCGNGTGTGANSGNWWAWFGGIASDETGSLSQDVTILEGSSATLSFYYELTVTEASSAFIEVLLGGVSVFLDNSNTAAGTYSLLTFDVSSFADGGTYNLQINSSTSGGNTNFFIDDVSLLVETDPVAVSAPFSLSIFAFGLAALWLRRKA
jgi:hypothetical protein